MMAKTAPRSVSYGQQRTFRGLEDFAIQRRVARARSLLDEVLGTHSGKGIDVLELGCGYAGQNLVQLSSEYPVVDFTGVDLSVSKNVSGVRLLEGDVATWQPDKDYDVVFSLAVVEHLLAPDVHFELISKALAPKGIAGLTTPTPLADPVLSFLASLGIFDREEIKDHKLYLTEAGLEQLAAQTGLVVEHYEKFSFGMNQWLILRKD